MLPDELRKIMEFLKQRVHLKEGDADGEVVIGFDSPTSEEMARADLNPDGARQIMEAPWWDEMVVDIVETPEMCDPEDPPAQVLEYARDVVSEYLRKRVQL